MLLSLVALLVLGGTWVAASNGLSGAAEWVHSTFHDPDACGGG